MLLLREWYMHPNGQIPAYEFAFSRRQPAGPRLGLLARLQDDRPAGSARPALPRRASSRSCCSTSPGGSTARTPRATTSSPAASSASTTSASSTARSRCPTGGFLEQADGTAWMAFYCVTMLAMALELARENPAYEDVASKFFEHFVAIADAMNSLGGTGLWDEEDGFYYDQLHVDGRNVPLRVRSLVGLISAVRRRGAGAGRARPAARLLEAHAVVPRQPQRPAPAHLLHGRARRRARPGTACWRSLRATGWRRVLRYLLDENEFLSPYGIRSLSRVHQRPSVRVSSRRRRATGSTTSPANRPRGLFGGNSNWRGPVWFPINYLLIEALERYHHFYGDALRVECPTGSGRMMNLDEVAREIGLRLVRIFLRDCARPAALSRRTIRVSPTIRTGATCCCSTSTSTATPAAASGPATRRAGPRW